MTAPTSKEVLAEVLSDPRLESVVFELGAEPDGLTVEALARRVATDEWASERCDSLESVTIELYHNCVPKLEELGVVAFERDARYVRLSHELALFERTLEAMNRTIARVDEMS